MNWTAFHSLVSFYGTYFGSFEIVGSLLIVLVVLQTANLLSPHEALLIVLVQSANLLSPHEALLIDLVQTANLLSPHKALLIV